MKPLICALVAFATLNLVAATPLLGGYETANVNDDFVQKAAQVAVEKMTSNRNNVVYTGISSASSQVIAGIKYILTLSMTIDNEPKECNVVVIYRADLQTWSVSSDENDPCNSLLNGTPSVVAQRRKRRAAHLLGGREDLDLNDSGVQEAAGWAVNQINGRSNSMYRQALQRIAEGTRQVVNGYKYRFLLYLVSTTCLNNAGNSDKTLDECPAGDNSMHQQCDVTVVKSSGGKFSMLNSRCKPLKQPHGKVSNLIGGDDHDYKPHGSPINLIGGGDHDYKPHGNPINNLIGRDDHDYKPHGNPINNLIGGGDHDYKPHEKSKTLLGQDWHDLVPHLKSIGGIMSDRKVGEKLLSFGKDLLHQSGDAVEKLKILGGDTHDYQPHRADPCQEHRIAFEKFKSEHKRLYATPQAEGERFQVFCGNMERVKEYQKMERGSAVYGATKFADISEKEFKAKYLGFKMNTDNEVKWPLAEIPKGPKPDAWDWREHNAVTPVKNQGSCGSCWAFSTTGNIEGRNAIKNKKLVSLSEQELVDCDKIDEGCNGGLPIQAYKAIMELGGIEPEKDYKYEGDTEKCLFNKSEVAVKLSGALNISKNEDEMAAWLYKNGPISIGINAFAMQFYMGGIAHPWKIFCNPSHLDHGVLIVGYGKQGSEPYWIVKNSWGPSWGRQGYYYVYRGDGVCGLNTMCSSAIVD